MKKLLYALACAMVAFACTPDQDGTEGPVVVNPDDVLVGKKEVLDPDTQKVKLEQVGNKLLDLFSAKEYEDMVELSEVIYSHCNKYFADEDYDWSELEEAGEDIFRDLYDEDQKGNKWEYTYTLFLSNCTGTVTLGKRSADYKESKDTKLIVEDVDGVDWEATLVSKNLKEVYLGEWIDTWYGYGYDEESGRYDDIKYQEIYDITVEIPESLTFEVKKDGKFFAEVTLGFDYSISNGGVDYERDRFGVTTEIKIDDLVLVVEKASANAKTGDVELSQSLTKGGMLIFSQNLTANADVEVEEEDGEIEEARLAYASLNIDLNLIGELQIKGTCTDLAEVIELLEEDFETERACERAAEDATELINLNVYYDCTPTVQARIEFEPVVEEEYGYEYYWIEPVIVFEDGSRYTFEKYFRERDFRDLIQNFEDFMYDYEDMVEDIY